MVDALRACRRVLRPGGQLVDMRPPGTNREIEVILDEESVHAGIVDVSRGNPDDRAAAAAVQNILADGGFIRETVRVFIYSYYWDSLAAARRHIEEIWGDFTDVRPEVWTRAEALIAARPGATVRVAVRGLIQVGTFRRV